jgi:hypothetical protein
MSANQQPIPVIKEIKGDPNNNINISLSKLGICAVVMVPMFRSARCRQFDHGALQIFRGRND